MTWSNCHEVEPGHDIEAIDVVLYDRREPSRAVFVGDLRRESIAQVQQPSGFTRAFIVVMDPSPHGPAIELAAADVDAGVEPTGEQVRDGRLARRLDPHDQPDFSTHPHILIHYRRDDAYLVTYRCPMKVLRCSSPEEFLAETTDYRGRDPIRTNVLGSVAVLVSKYGREYDAYWWWVVKDGGEVVGAAFRTAPFGLQLGPMSTNAAAALAPAVVVADDEFPWLAGPRDVVAPFLDAYQASRGARSRREFIEARTSLLYEITDVRVPTVSGWSRVATLDDFDLVDEWTTDFAEFIDGAPYAPSESDRAALRIRLTSNARRLWIDNDVAVSMAGHAPAVETPGGLVTRVGPVYTPANLRGHGYGSAITASLSEELLRGGSRVMLYADEANRTSNSIYQHIGYQLIDKLVQFDFVASAEESLNED